MAKKSIVAHFFNWVKSIFLNGLLIILPLALTIGIITYTFKFFKNLLEPLTKCKPIWRCIPSYLQQLPHAEFLVVLLFVLLVGFIFRLFFVRRILHGIEQAFFQIPLMNQLYFGIKQMVKAFTQDQVTFQHVVLIEFPRKGIYSLGFLTSQAASHLHPEADKNYFNIFIPTTPNPTSGYLIVVQEDDFTIVDLTRQEAMSLIISGGIVRPERFEKKTP